MKQLYEHNQLLETAFRRLEHDELSQEMRHFADQCQIPIIDDSGLETILQFLKLKKPKRILEIGSAIGYWSTMVARHTGAEVVTIERDDQNYQRACSYIARSSAAQQVNIYHADALTVDVAFLKDQVFDVIFIDAAKSAYQRFFEKYEPFLAHDGLMISDNLLFHGHIFTDQQALGRNLRDLTRKIKTYSAWLEGHPHYDTIFLPLGDGLAFSYRRKGGGNEETT
ncbi:MAG: O-methyltransferase [Defluviitaleaceae bacterium]|nr:O-methyltransferase [Defluviitaleaceae bacterium]